MENERINRLKLLDDTVRSIYDGLKKRENILESRHFTLANTVLVNPNYIHTLFPFYYHSEGVRQAIDELNNLPNSNSGNELVLIYSKRVGQFYLLFKSLQSFIDVNVTIHEELKKEYSSILYSS